MKPTELEKMLECMSIEGLTDLMKYINALLDEKKKEREVAQAESDLVEAYQHFRTLFPDRVISFRYDGNNWRLC